MYKRGHVRVGITSAEGSKIWLASLLAKNFTQKFALYVRPGKIVDSDVQGQTTVVVWATIHLIIPTFAHNTTTTASEYNHIYH